MGWYWRVFGGVFEDDLQENRFVSRGVYLSGGIGCSGGGILKYVWNIRVFMGFKYSYIECWCWWSMEM